ncbi:uridine nucleosidase [Diplodia corticola]|uniref:Uridine nucleosidase n=1 Tax=Diplodia corticola TaxID=236234 RepID=A0A1J9QJT3_9PEZI|nr:uridine nucleosidase [Diplodia corticola]OJD29126.1 uridine nucleosidase [Diplodia corticola]
MTAEAASVTPLWLDVDPGHDDAFALLLAAHSPHVHLLGVSTVHGNASLHHTTQNGLSILEAIGCRHIPLYPGASKPLVRDAVHAASIHGESGLDGTTIMPKPVRDAVRDVDSVEAMYAALITTPPKTAWLVATGTLTNAARLIQEHPDLAAHLKGLSIMGGAIGGGFTDAPLGKVAGEGERFGNWTPYAEFNIYCDPEAAQFLLTHPIIAPKTTIMPLDLTHQVLGTPAVQSKLLGLPGGIPARDSPDKPLPTPVRALFHEIMTFFAKTYAEEFALTAGPPLHDPLAVAAAFAPDIFVDGTGDNGNERFAVTVVTAGEHRADPALNLADAEAVGQLGRTLVTRVEEGERGGGVRIPRSLDVARFWDMVDEALGRAEEVSPLPGLGVGWWGTRM